MSNSKNSITVAMAIDDTDMLIILRFSAICILFNCSTTLYLLQRIKKHDERLFRSVFLGQSSSTGNHNRQEDGPGYQGDETGDLGNQEGNDDSPNSDSSGGYDFYH